VFFKIFRKPVYCLSIKGFPALQNHSFSEPRNIFFGEGGIAKTVDNPDNDCFVKLVQICHSSFSL